MLSGISFHALLLSFHQIICWPYLLNYHWVGPWKLHLWQNSMSSLNWKCCHFDIIFIIGFTGSCQNDNFQCNQWWKFHQNDISVSAFNLIASNTSQTNPCFPWRYNISQELCKWFTPWCIYLAMVWHWAVLPISSRVTLLALGPSNRCQ